MDKIKWDTKGHIYLLAGQRSVERIIQVSRYRSMFQKDILCVLVGLFCF